VNDRLERTLDDLRRKWVPDRRTGVFDVSATADSLVGRTTSREALGDLRRVGADASLAVAVTLLPDASVDDGAMAVVTAALAPLLERPAIAAPRLSEALHGEPLSLLERRDDWLHTRGADGYIGWIHAGYVHSGSPDWLEDWLGRASAQSLGCELEYQGMRLRLPIGARLSPRRDGQVETADGRLARVFAGMVRPLVEVHAEARLIAVPELALRWFGGAPYQWGGRTEWGVDCSGLVQAIYAEEVRPSPTGAGYQGGDLLFFAEDHRVSHVALWAGAGRVVHSTLARGGVASEDLFGDVPRLRRLRENLVGVRRVGKR
jgi:hypothetical protein